MIRDMDLIRQILFEIEASPTDQIYFVPEVEGFSNEEISYHIKLLHQAGYVEAYQLAIPGEEIWKTRALTWQGHEFLDAARDDTRWNKAKDIVKEKGGGMVIEVVKTVLVDLMKGQIFGA